MTHNVSAGLAVLRSSRVIPLVTSSLLAILLVCVPVVTGFRLELLDVTTFIDLTMITMLAGAAFTLDDSSMTMTAALPYDARRVAVTRMLATTLFLVLPWAVVLRLGPQLVANALPYETAGLIIQPFAILPWVFSLAWLRGRTAEDGLGSVVAAPGLLVLAFTLALVPDGFSFYVGPGTPAFGASRVRWALLLLVGLMLLVVSLRDLSFRRRG